MKGVVAAFNQEKALVGAFSVIVQPVVEPMDRFTALIVTEDIVAMHTTAWARQISGCRFPLPVATTAAAPHRRQGEQRAGRGQVYLFSAVTNLRKKSEVWSPAFTRWTWRLPDHFLLVSDKSGRQLASVHQLGW